MVADDAKSRSRSRQVSGAPANQSVTLPVWIAEIREATGQQP
jgi:hypothetical protein